jgi:hypothetical protein
MFKDRVSHESLWYIRFRELAEIAYQLTGIYLDMLHTICFAPI